MLKLLLDEHLSPVIDRQIRSHNAAIDILSVLEWEGGRFLSKVDEELLLIAYEYGRTLVTFDQQTNPPILVRLANEGKSHGGVIFVSGKTIAPSNFGTMVRSLIALWEETWQDDWTDITRYLQI
jgi:hypothetical protein